MKIPQSENHKKKRGNCQVKFQTISYFAKIGCVRWNSTSTTTYRDFKWQCKNSKPRWEKRNNVSHKRARIKGTQQWKSSTINKIKAVRKPANNETRWKRRSQIIAPAADLQRKIVITHPTENGIKRSKSQNIIKNVHCVWAQNVETSNCLHEKKRNEKKKSFFVLSKQMTLLFEHTRKKRSQTNE